ncbi:DNA methyltransferase [Candidatus Falkowbacteria bacterium RIFOXYB2_FULL_34_18]|uniref:DNA methyltransferase n=1 Tax=Candidatus Falkowbacteria bacterium RIFOXYD2_FULL_34_120 TaxID=1798007 RepID=A0A1F5TSF0_9BACT|nr:MAG: DNA methyltransferase [Candidatus Falkowbacteria bacterium RIFOXYB2_FULL_34_18]OGF29682.1 MAG: DNA methyltransferase [Candidatus Falkowbacteria bacterium RIFOXYC12_FULL_34_55]OGF37305.1 MAG: DNA methyltransferase [Candidatus Falkowbacteria bacterium RIFOXYC2_FULL_34_220]OGF39178.1 MAG: DNA methyltransferase [Candidatus Falkowbacteria bacterium RIFOXYD12_FULL_34_57]OGF41727.1 MAG: DNA methyltransferase [Candidatus Falkowbacteria bacterium RIFOXYD2_FULL_34_120]
MANSSNLNKAKKAKNDEFYTQYYDIQIEIDAYLQYNPDVYRSKVVYCNCDDPYESNFFRYFVLNFNKLGLKQLITTSYKPSPVANTQLALFGDDKTLTKSKGRPKINANKFIINEVHDIDGDGEFNLKDVAKQLKTNKHNEWTPLVEDGDFRSPECVELLKQSDIVVTNPPFSLFREYVKQLFDYNKNFVIIGNMNAITYKEVFPKIKENKMWLGATNFNTGMYFQVPDEFIYADSYKFEREKNGVKMNRVPGVCWFTNLDHGRRHQPLPLMTETEVIKFVTKKPFEKYDNYNAIEISFVKNIPSDFKGVMGVPISFLDKYNPDQFDILGATQRGCHDEVPDTKKYDDYWEVRQNGKKTGSSGGKTNENANLFGNDGKKNYFINKDGRIIQSAYQRIFIKHKKK